MSLIDELQREALETTTSVAQLLRKALVVARKLGLKDFEGWVSSELNGYEAREIPQYRHVDVRIMAQNPYRGWIPFVITDAEIDRMLSKTPTGQPIGEIEHLLANHDPEAHLTMPISGPMQATLLRKQDVVMPLAFHIDSSTLHGIVDRVRNLVLEWTLNLEGEGITGSGMSFSPKERERAVQNPQITNFITNNIERMAGSAIQQGTATSTQVLQTLDLDELRALVSEFEEKLQQTRELEPEVQKTLEADLRILATTLSSPKPNEAIAREALRSVRNVLEGIGASLLGQALWNKLLGLPM
jgi:hypothetical protein